MEWAGAELHLEPPPPSAFGGSAASDSVAEAEAGPTLPREPVLYLASRDSVGATLVPVAVIVGDSLRALPDEDEMPGFAAAFAGERMAPGARFTLFSEGVRVGTLVAAESFTDDSFCQPRPAVRGPVELVPEAAENRRFLALARGDAGSVPYGVFQAPGDTRNQRVASINMTGEIIPRVGARWPTSLPVARRDMQAFRLGEGGPDAFAATFLFRDEMEIAEAEPASWALFLMGVAQGEEYRPAYVWYRPAAREGRGVPRFVDHYDWDGDGESEILLEVLGERSRWTAAIGRVGGEWRRIWEDPCGVAAPPVTDGAEG